MPRRLAPTARRTVRRATCSTPPRSTSATRPCHPRCTSRVWRPRGAENEPNRPTTACLCFAAPNGGTARTTNDTPPPAGHLNAGSRSSAATLPVSRARHADTPPRPDTEGRSRGAPGNALRRGRAPPPPRSAQRKGDARPSAPPVATAHSADAPRLAGGPTPPVRRDAPHCMPPTAGTAPPPTPTCHFASPAHPPCRTVCEAIAEPQDAPLDADAVSPSHSCAMACS